MRFALGALLFIGRMARSVEVETHAPSLVEDRADDANGQRTAYDPAVGADPETVVYRISGAFFFGAAATVAAVLDRIADQRKNFILDCSAVPFLDSTAANVIEGEVTEVVFLGDSLDCRARVGSTELGMRLHPSNTVAVGDGIRMRVDPRDVAVLAN